MSCVYFAQGARSSRIVRIYTKLVSESGFYRWIYSLIRIQNAPNYTHYFLIQKDLTTQSLDKVFRFWRKQGAFSILD